MDIKKQEEYLMILADELKYLKKKDAEKVLSYYQQRINNALDYGEKEEDVLRSLPTPQEAAEGAYESHGLKYKELRMRTHKVKHNFQLVFNGIICFLIVAAFLGILVLGYFLTKNNILFIGKLFSLKGGLNIAFCLLLSIGYVAALIAVLIYIIDLFYIVFMQFFQVYIKDDEKVKKLMNFTLSSKIGELVHYDKAVSRFLIGSILVTVIFMCCSYFTKGYVYSALQDKPSNKEEIVLDEFTDIDIVNNNANINIIKGDSFKLEYFYEFKHDLALSVEGSKLSLDVKASKNYDIFNLLKEPTQTINIYVPEDLGSVSIHTQTGIIQFNELNIDSLNLLGDVKATFAIKGSSINSLTVEGYELYCGLNSSLINNVSFKSTTGQFIIEEACSIIKLNVDNSAGIINFKNSEIDNLTITNRSGALNLEGLTGNKLDLSTKSNQSLIKNSAYIIIKTENKITSNLTFDHVIATEAIISKVDSSYYTYNCVKCPNIDIEGNNSFIFINGVGRNPKPKDEENSKAKEGEEQAPITNDIYNDERYKDIISKMNVSNKGTNSKIQIGTSTLEYLSLVQVEGFILLTESRFTKSKIVSDKVRIFEMVEIKNPLMELYLTKTESTSLDLTNISDVYILCKKIDASSRANMRLPKDFVWKIEEDTNTEN